MQSSLLMKPFEPKRVVVVTGASSGIARATVLEFAKNDAAIVLASRNEAALKSIAAECRQAGAKPLAVAVDVTDAAAVDQLARTAVKRFGRIDVWINNAAVGVGESINGVTQLAQRRLIETNMLGYLHGTWSAIAVFRKQGRGTLINNVSMGVLSSVPRSTSYLAGRHVVQGLTLSLQQDLAAEGYRDIHVSLIHPGMVDGLATHPTAGDNANAITAESVAKRLTSQAAAAPPRKGPSLSLVAAGVGCLAGFLATPKH